MLRARAPLRRPAVVLFAVLAPLLEAPEARADDVKERCLAQYDSAQKERKQGKLLAAREQLRACVSEACPALVQRDCADWLQEVEEALPTVIVSARTPSGADLEDATVFVDGRRVARRLSGQPMPIDPGARVVRLERPGEKPLVRRIIVNAGEKNRLLRFTIAPASTEDSARHSAGAAPSSTPWLPIVIGGIGVIAIGAGAYVDARASSDLDELRGGCAPRCDESDVDDVKQRMIVGDALIATGIVAVGVAAVLWLTGSKSDAARGPERASRGVPRTAGFRF